MGDDDSFLSRWSRRKAQQRTGGVPAEPPIPPVTVPLPRVEPLPEADAGAMLPAGTAAAVPPVPTTAATLPTLADVAGLSHDADFSRFVMPGVDETVKRAAMKKLFSDPHFNVMDGLDTYVDDYGKPDPIPEAMLRRMTQSKFLRLFDEAPPVPDAQAKALPAQVPPDAAEAPALPQSRPGEAGAEAPEPAPSPHDVGGVAPLVPSDVDLGRPRPDRDSCQ
jgi:hypothetical protein